jgi:hypothetical protein
MASPAASPSSELLDSLSLFAELIGLLYPDSADVNQLDLQWNWFTDPVGNFIGSASDATIGIAAHRQYLGKLIRTLLGQNANDPDKTLLTIGTGSSAVSYSWAPVSPASQTEVGVQAGIAWSGSGPDAQHLNVGIGAQLSFAGGSGSLAIVAPLIEIGGGQVQPLAGQVHFKGTIPPPSFLKSITVEGDHPADTLALTLSDKSSNSRTLTVPASPDLNALGWDSARLLLFALKAWAQNVSGGGAALNLLNQHLFPMLATFPLLDPANTANPPDFKAWAAGFFDPVGNQHSALTLLWHLRALISGGNESPNFLVDASNGVFMQLASGAGGNGAAPASFTQSGSYPPAGAGAWIGLTSDKTLVLDIQSGTAAGSIRIGLAQLTASGLIRPTIDASGIASFLQSHLPGGLPFTPTQVSSKWTIPLFSQALGGPGLFSGTFALNAIVDAASGKICFQPQFGGVNLPLTLPPGAIPAQPVDPKQVIASALKLIVSLMPADGSKATAIATELATFIENELTSPASANIGLVLMQIATTLADGQTFSIVKPPPVEVSLGLAANGPSTAPTGLEITPKFSYGPLGPGGDFPISIGKVSASAGVLLDLLHSGKPSLDKFTFAIDDLRIGAGDMAGTSGIGGVIGSIIPDLKKAPGFHLELIDNKGKWQVDGGGKIPLQLTLGPLTLNQLLVDIGTSKFSIGIGVSFQLSVININAYELNISFPLQKGSIALPSLQGLGLSFDGAGIKLAGMFLNSNGDYIGGASVSVEDIFSLSALGAYKKVQSQSSMFIFASLVAPLGGPPFMFITGIAGGFGYNRMLPPVTLMSKHPFLRIMSGDLPVSDNKDALAKLDDPKNGFGVKIGDYWIAAGIQFVSFGFINGKVLVAVAFGHDLSFNLMGSASFGISPVAYFEIDIVVTVDREKFLLIAGLSPNSYLVHPDIFNLSGDFGLGVWHGGPHAGDFLLSIGGYHPYFKKPDYYPDLNRVSVKATVFGFVHLSVECFFACTPQALMAGASVSLSATFAGIGAGLDVYVDVFIQWDPFFLMATMGVTVWFEFLGRHEIGVDLKINTPPFGGVATIHLFIVSFDVSFGDDLPQGPPPPPIYEFMTNRLGVPATAFNPLGTGATVPLLHTAKDPGLIRIIFGKGLTINQDGDTSKEQEGSTDSSPVRVSPEFGFNVLTRLPFLLKSQAGLANSQPSVTGTVNLPLCHESDLDTQVTITAWKWGPAQAAQALPLGTSSKAVQISLLADLFAAANFGATPLTPAQADNDSARAMVSRIDTSQPSIPLYDGLSFQLSAAPQNPAERVNIQGPEEQLSTQQETYPLPLGWPAGVSPVYRQAKTRLQFASVATASVAQTAARFAPKASASRRAQALADLNKRIIAPIGIVSTAAPFARKAKIAPQSTSVSAPPAGVAVMAPPASPARRAELSAISLRILPARVAAAPVRPVTAVPLMAVNPAQPIRSVVLSPTIAAAVAGAVSAEPKPPSVTVASGQAVHLDITGGGALAGSLAFAGTQTVRAIFLTAFGEPIGDQYVAGNQTIPLPARTRRVALIGEGALTGAPASLGSVGVEASTALFAIGRNEFAAHGCVVQTKTALLKAFNPSDTLTGAFVLSGASSFRILFPAPPKTSALVITVTPATGNPAAASSQVRWRGINATLSNLKTVAGADRAAFVMDVAAQGAWQLDIDTGSDWRLASAVLCDISSADALAALQNRQSWHFVNDGFIAPAASTSTTVTLEVTNG